ncbi:MAG: nucleotidyltransferase family protein [Planctomycetota bacterium]|nr:nucleotidyltransferase family protein [Planctomycetota bacterium]
MTHRGREEIVQLLREQRGAIRDYGVRRLRLFGSCARNEAREVSDLDFLVDFEKKSFDAYMGLKEFLENLFGCPVDLVLSNAIKPNLRPFILKDAIDVEGL